MILFSIRQEEKKISIVRSENLVHDECAFNMKTINDLNFTKFINLTKTELDFNSNDENILYRSDIDDFVKIINDRQ